MAWPECECCNCHAFLDLQSASNDDFTISNAQRAAPAPPAVLPRVAVAAPAPWQTLTAPWSANSSMMPAASRGTWQEEQQASGSQDSSGQFRFLPGQRSSQDSQSTPSLSNRNVPRFLQDSWERGEPQPGPQRHPPPPPPPPPGTDANLPTSAIADLDDGIVLSMGVMFDCDGMSAAA